MPKWGNLVPKCPHLVCGAILKELKKENTKYALQEFVSAGKTRELICYNEKIVVPSSLHKTVVHWYHHYLGI